MLETPHTIDDITDLQGSISHTLINIQNHAIYYTFPFLNSKVLMSNIAKSNGRINNLTQRGRSDGSPLLPLGLSALGPLSPISKMVIQEFLGPGGIGYPYL